MKSNYKSGDFLDFDLMYDALKKSCNNVRWKTSVTSYETNAIKNTTKLIQEIKSGTYEISEYSNFTITEPKERNIMATRIRDRQVQRSLCDNYLYSAITSCFIYDNCACQKGKGTDFTYKRIKTHLSKAYREYGSNDFWYLKCDIHHFFESIDHDKLKEFVRKRVKFDLELDLVFQVIDSFGDRGLGLGSQLSQLLALLYLNELDHLIKEHMHIKHYVRYMDDFCIFSNNKEELIKHLSFIEDYLKSIGLELNKKTTIQPIRRKMRFMNWRFTITESGKVLMLQDRKKISDKRKKIIKMINLVKINRIKTENLEQSLNGIIAHLEKGNSYTIIKEFKNYIKNCSMWNNLQIT